MTSEKMLHLYSSNLRPLYSQDILDLAALPLGSRYLFRYLDKWVTETTRAQWEQLGGTEVLVTFSIQQVAEYHDPAFIPVRLGVVTNTQVVGNFYLVEFELRDYVALRKAVAAGRPREVYGPSVRNYCRQLEARQIPRPYETWAAVGESVMDLLDSARGATKQMHVFERTTEFLQATDSFQSARFFRVLNLRQSGEEYSSDAEFGIPQENGKFVLQCGRTYELTIGHTQPTDIDRREEFIVTTDQNVLGVIGEPRFEVSSRYDIVKIFLHTTESPANEVRETVLAIDPQPGVLGPRLRLRIEVRPNVGRTLIAVAVSALAAVALGLPSLLPSLSDWAKVMLVSSAAVLFGGLSSYGLKRE